MEKEVFDGLDEHLKENPIVSTKRTFSTLRANGIKPLWRLRFQHLPLSTFRAIVGRFKDKHNILLRRQHRDHCICGICVVLQNQIQGTKDLLVLTEDPKVSSFLL